MPKNAIAVTGDLTLDRDVVLEGLFPLKVPSGDAIKIVATLPDGETKPLLWLYEYNDRYQHPFLFRQVIELPPGTVIRGVPRDAEIALLPGKKSKPSNRTLR